MPCVYLLPIKAQALPSITRSDLQYRLRISYRFHLPPSIHKRTLLCPQVQLRYLMPHTYNPWHPSVFVAPACACVAPTIICVFYPEHPQVAPSLTWQPVACSCGCAILQGQHAVGTGTQQLPWLGTQSHTHSRSLEPDALPLLKGEGREGCCHQVEI